MSVASLKNFLVLCAHSFFHSAPLSLNPGYAPGKCNTSYNKLKSINEDREVANWASTKRKIVTAVNKIKSKKHFKMEMLC